MTIFLDKINLVKKTICLLSFTALFLLSPAPGYSLSLNGFLEGAYGMRFNDDVTKRDDYNLAEGRFQIRGSHSPDVLEDWEPEFRFKGDVLHDAFEETTKGLVREASLTFTPHDSLDIKFGRQILTWGTGDFLFINDLFPKDYVSFFSGRDDEYLKLPSDALKSSLFLDEWSIDVVLIPRFEPNNSLTGRRFSYYDGLNGSIVGVAGGGSFIEPERSVENMEKTARFYRNFGRYETAIYLFDGFYKEPLGVTDPVNREFFYPELNVYGASVRGPFGGGIGNMEAGYYDSRNDRDGDDPLVENPAFKFLAGYERDLGSDFKAGLQYQLEKMLDYDAFLAAGGSTYKDENRHLFSLRLTKLAMNQNFVLSFFGFYSPSDKDYYMRPKVSYKFTDALSLTLGGNIFGGKHEQTFFGQLKRNDNLYTRLRYNF